MNSPKWRQKMGLALLLGLALVLMPLNTALAAGGMDAVNKWAWGTNSGWINLAPDNGGVTVYSDHLEGYAWSEALGWIRMGTNTLGGAHTYPNDAAGTYGVNNDGVGNLSGFAWSANAGWINFAPANGGVWVDPVTGGFEGYAWGENVGWIKFKGTAASSATYQAQTAWHGDLLAAYQHGMAAVISSHHPGAASSNGLNIANVSFLNDPGDGILFGHNNAAFATLTSSLPGGVDQRWARTWQLDVKDGAGVSGGQVTLTFDIAVAGGQGSFSSAGKYDLLKRAAGSSDTFTTVAVIGSPSFSADFKQITFTVDVGQPGSEFTLGLTNTPTLTDLSLDIGPTAGGSPVVITGVNLTGGAVTFGGTAAACTVDSDTQITCTSPAHAAGTVDVAVTTTGGTTTLNTRFTYVGAVQAISPNFGPIAGGTTLTLVDGTGPNFSGATAVTFGGTPAASFTVNSGGEITVVTPAHASGMVDVVVSAPAGTYTYPGGFAFYGAHIPLAPISTPAANATLPFNQSPSQWQVRFNKDMLHVSAADANWSASALNPANYLLVSIGLNGVFDTQTCLAGIQSDDGPVTINSVTYNATSYTATLSVNNGQPLPVGQYQLLVCGTTSIKDPNDVKLNAGLQDTRFALVINPSSNPPGTGGSSQAGILPATGFAPDRVTLLAKQAVPYAGMANLRLEIPVIGVRMNIVGVPQTGGGWDVSWLGKDAGYLAGSAYPTHTGNSVLTGHVWDASNQPGPFVYLGRLIYGDMIQILAFGQVYTYEVRENRLVGPGNVNSVMKHEGLSWVTLLTCESYNAGTGSYAYRRMVRAILINVK